MDNDLLKDGYTLSFVETANYTEVIVDEAGNLLDGKVLGIPILEVSEVETPAYESVLIDSGNHQLTAIKQEDERLVEAGDLSMVSQHLSAGRIYNTPKSEITENKHPEESYVEVENAADYVELHTDKTGITHEAVRTDGVHEFPFGVLAGTLAVRDETGQAYSLSVHKDATTGQVSLSIRPQ